MKKLMLLVAFLGFLGMQAFAQKTITGTVTSAEDGSALPGVSVVVKGTTIGTITDVDGKYTLSGVPEDAKTLVFSFVGFKTLEVPITGNVINVKLEPEAVQVEEVVVTALGLSREQKALGYAVQEVKADDISNVTTGNVVDALNGRVAGVLVNRSSGSAGAGTYIEIRGAASITGNNQPLFVVDGIPIDNSGGYSGVAGVDESNRAIDLNPDDIESITVLKGGAATALYGLRAANGVIIITTKKGKNTNNRVNVEINSRVTVSEANKLPPMQTKYVQGSQALADFYDWYLQVVYGLPDPSAWGLFGYGIPFTEADAQHYHAVSWGPSVDSVVWTTDTNYVPGYYYLFGGLTTMEDWMTYWDPNGRVVPKWLADSLGLQNTKPFVPYDKYALFQKGLNFKNSISLSAGNDFSTYYFSASTEQDEGIVPNNVFNKNTLKFSANYKVGKRFQTGFDITYANTGGNRLQKGSNLSGVMLGLTRTPINFDNSLLYEFPEGSVIHYADGTIEDVSGQQRSFRGISYGYDNPYWTINNIYYRDRVNRMIANIHFQYDLTSNLNIFWRLGGDWWAKKVDEYFKPHSNEMPTGYRGRYFTNFMDLNSDLMLRYSKTFGSFDVNLLVGNNIFQRKSESVSAYGQNIIIADFENMASSADPKGSEGTYMKRTAAYYFSADFSYMNMLYLTLTGRNEWSTTMPYVNGKPKGFFYPSVSLGFIFTELPFLKGNKILNFGKLRASYAKIANDAAAYATLSYYSVAGVGDGWTSGVSFPYNGIPGFTHSYGMMPNTDLRPETQITQEIGAELHFFNSRVTIDASYFYNKNYDLLLAVPVAPSTGYNTMYLNAASMHTTGIEVVLGLTPVKTKDLIWTMNFNFSNPYTVVDKLAEGVDNVFLGGFVEPQIRAVAGEGYRSIYATGWVTDDGTINGNLIINDADSIPGLLGFPIMDDVMRSYGTIQPKFILSWNNSISFKGLSLSWLLEWKKGGLMWNGTKGALYFFGTHKDTEIRGTTTVWEGLSGHVGADGNIYHYEVDDQGNVTEVPGPGGTNTTEVVLDEYWYWWNGYGSGFTGPSNQFIEPTDWLRLRQLTLSYSLPSKLLNKVKLNKLQLEFVGYNLFLKTPYTGVDPETSLLGVSNGLGMDYFNMPGVRSYTIGVKIGF